MFQETQYVEIDVHTLAKNWEEVVRGMLPAGFKLEDVRSRNIELPTDPSLRRERVREIVNNGSDRTKPGEGNPVYELEAQRLGVDSLSLIYTNPPADFIRQVSVEEEQGFITDELGQNGVLVYDATTDVGIRLLYPPDGLMAIFNNNARRSEALIGIIYIAS